MKSEKTKKTARVEREFDFYIWQTLCHLAKERKTTPDVVVDFFLSK